jgi:hypothetical protein
MSLPSTDEWPTHREELSRKLTETTARYVSAHAEGKISDKELYRVVSALWDTCSGLVEGPPLRLLEEIHKELRKTMLEKRKARLNGR